jgi:hypothetical protein
VEPHGELGRSGGRAIRRRGPRGSPLGRPLGGTPLALVLVERGRGHGEGEVELGLHQLSRARDGRERGAVELVRARDGVDGPRRGLGRRRGGCCGCGLAAGPEGPLEEAAHIHGGGAGSLGRLHLERVGVVVRVRRRLHGLDRDGRDGVGDGQGRGGAVDGQGGDSGGRSCEGGESDGVEGSEARGREGHGGARGLAAQHARELGEEREGRVERGRPARVEECGDVEGDLGPHRGAPEEDLVQQPDERGAGLCGRERGGGGGRRPSGGHRRGRSRVPRRLDGGERLAELQKKRKETSGGMARRGFPVLGVRWGDAGRGSGCTRASTGGQGAWDGPCADVGAARGSGRARSVIGAPERTWRGNCITWGLRTSFSARGSTTTSAPWRAMDTTSSVVRPPEPSVTLDDDAMEAAKENCGIARRFFPFRPTSQRRPRASPIALLPPPSPGPSARGPSPPRAAARPRRLPRPLRVSSWTAPAPAPGPGRAKRPRARSSRRRSTRRTAAAARRPSRRRSGNRSRTSSSRSAATCVALPLSLSLSLSPRSFFPSPRKPPRPSHPPPSRSNRRPRTQPSAATGWAPAPSPPGASSPEGPPCARRA